jgi:hypothetical protein
MLAEPSAQHLALGDWQLALSDTIEYAAAKLKESAES